jgi:hypothetical protein
MIFTVSTVFDTPENVQQFVERNLAAGVDHMFIFLDRRQPRVLRYLKGNPHTTPVPTQDGYWGGRHPPSLNVRQTANANLVRVLLAAFGWAQWLFHLDGDECPDMNRDRLLSLGPELRVVSLQTMEAISVPGGETHTRFKRQLDTGELALLQILGVIPRPDNASYFNGHAHGKVGIRPTLDFNLHIHRARDVDGEIVEPYTADDMRLLHYDAISLEAFVQKWTTHAAAEQDSVFGRKKARILAAVRSVQRNPNLGDEDRARYIRLIYERTVQDDVALLDELGYVVVPEPARHSHTPTLLSDAQSSSMHTLLLQLCEADKRYFRPRESELQVTDLLTRCARTLHRDDPELAAALAACVAASSPSRGAPSPG